MRFVASESARFSFLLATPIIAGAGVLEIPKLLHHGATASIGFGTAALGGLVAAATAYASTAFPHALLQAARRAGPQSLRLLLRPRRPIGLAAPERRGERSDGTAAREG
jgi:hypothetical protein